MKTTTDPRVLAVVLRERRSIGEFAEIRRTRSRPVFAVRFARIWVSARIADSSDWCVFLANAEAFARHVSSALLELGAWLRIVMYFSQVGVRSQRGNFL